jgi:hypothetical protein
MNTSSIVLLIAFSAVIILLAVGVSLPRIPGDLAFKGSRATLYIPIGTCIVLSIILSILFSLFGRR